MQPRCTGSRSARRSSTRPSLPIPHPVDLTLAAFFLAPGLALGSFLNVVAARVPLRVMDIPGSAGFYASCWGILPYAITSHPLEHFELYRVE